MENKKCTALITAWKLAQNELGLELIVNYVMNTSSGKVVFPVFVKKFGRKKGTLISTHTDFRDNSMPSDKDYYFSIINENQYSKFDKALFIETLEDWGYYGKADTVPKWFKGYVHNNTN